MCRTRAGSCETSSISRASSPILICIVRSTGGVSSFGRLTRSIRSPIRSTCCIRSLICFSRVPGSVFPLKPGIDSEVDGGSSDDLPLFLLDPPPDFFDELDCFDLADSFLSCDWPSSPFEPKKYE
jgi:hypothetical protein